ncbi:MAG: disulfide bond formation protein B [Pseudolabrys sp.]
MKADVLSPELARALNFAGLMAMIGVILGAYVYQFAYRELPCTLCLLQRLAMFAVAFGAAMNLMLGPHPRHYGVCLVSAVFGISISIRQTLLHINPYFDTAAGKPTLSATANPPFGQAVFGLDLYAWGVILFGTVILAVGIVQLFPSQFRKADPEPQWLTKLATIGVGIFFVVAALETLTTFLECGFSDCPNDGKWNWKLLG